MILPAYAEDVNLKLPSPSCGKAILWNEDASGLCNSDVDINNLDAALTEAVATTTANAAATAEQSAIASGAGRCCNGESRRGDTGGGGSRRSYFAKAGYRC
ncbi:MAG: hypothetical protein ACLU99_12140 [Alphaproteobacteria bacterium]